MNRSATPSELLDKLLEVTILLSTDMDRELARVGLTTARAHLIWVLAAHGPSMQQLLAARLDVTARNITTLVDGLVGSGFVSRESHPTDRRAFLVTLTDQGRAVADRLNRERGQLAADLFDELEDGRRADLLDMMTEITSRLDDLIRAAAVAQEARAQRLDIP